MLRLRPSYQWPLVSPRPSPHSSSKEVCHAPNSVDSIGCIGVLLSARAGADFLLSRLHADGVLALSIPELLRSIELRVLRTTTDDTVVLELSRRHQLPGSAVAGDKLRSNHAACRPHRHVHVCSGRCQSRPNPGPNAAGDVPTGRLLEWRRGAELLVWTVK
jgi:hypothetical protein